MNVFVHFPHWCFFSATCVNCPFLSALKPGWRLKFDVGGAAIGGATIWDADVGGATAQDEEGYSVPSIGGFLSISLQKRKETTPVRPT